MFYVYILKSLKNGRFYVGYTNNLARRLSEHGRGHSRSSKNVRPFILVHVEKYVLISEAILREKFLKSGQGREWLKQKFS